LVMLIFAAGNLEVMRKICRQTADDVWPTSLYASNQEIKLMKILRQFPAGNVLVNRDTGNKIGWLGMHNVFLGHWGTTPDKGLKQRALEAFYNPGTATDQRISLLKKYNIRYIWYGQRERKLGPWDSVLPVRLIAREDNTFLFEYD
jgi:hypothetical protein